MQQYIFAYGSLLSSESRAHTAPTESPVPARLTGYRRGWYFHDSEFGYSALGIVADTSASCNGVLLPVTDEQLPCFDKREVGYDRVDVTQQVSCAQSVEGQARVWVYVVSDKKEPCAEYPIAQSYLDVTLWGCLEQGIEHAREFVRSTYDWNNHWLNDREEPIFKRCLRCVVPDQVDAHLAPVLALRNEQRAKR